MSILDNISPVTKSASANVAASANKAEPFALMPKRYMLTFVFFINTQAYNKCSVKRGIYCFNRLYDILNMYTDGYRLDIVNELPNEIRYAVSPDIKYIASSNCVIQFNIRSRNIPRFLTSLIRTLNYADTIDGMLYFSDEVRLIKTGETKIIYHPRYSYHEMQRNVFNLEEESYYNLLSSLENLLGVPIEKKFKNRIRKYAHNLCLRETMKDLNDEQKFKYYYKNRMI